MYEPKRKLRTDIKVRANAPCQTGQDTHDQLRSLSPTAPRENFSGESFGEFSEKSHGGIRHGKSYTWKIAFNLVFALLAMIVLAALYFIIYDPHALPTGLIPLALQDNDDVHGLIVGGKEAEPHEFPFLVNLQLTVTVGKKERKDLVCGGTILEERYVLTAAHCFYDDKEIPFPTTDVFTIVAGDHNWKKEDDIKQKRKILRLVPHEKYNHHTSFDHDIAILKLDTPFDLNENVAKGNLLRLENEDLVGEEAIVAGWGLKRYRGIEQPKELRKVAVPVVDNVVCDASYQRAENPSRITEKMLCAGDMTKYGNDACQGDSGGPLTVHLCHQPRRHVVGVVSYGEGCGLKGFPGVYTRVTSYLKWIDDTIARLKK